MIGDFVFVCMDHISTHDAAIELIVFNGSGNFWNSIWEYLLPVSFRQLFAKMFLKALKIIENQTNPGLFTDPILPIRFF